ncbi:MAG: carboxypeptidase regulatory-like domain-containing protein [Planctomycetes bacterium]|nr:carboxypeptidase regulatory-like domain-containing protein [Planctomycetota bacterium]
MNAKLKAGLAALVAVGVAVAAGMLLLDDGNEGKPSPSRAGSRKTLAPSPARSRVGAPPKGSRPTGSNGGSAAQGTPAGTSSSGTPRPTRNGARPGSTPGSGNRGGQPGGRPVALKVICEDGTGRPLSGVRIEARRKSGMPLEAVLSDSNGHASLGGLPAGETISGVARHARVKGGVPFGPIRVEAGASLRVRLNLARLGRLVGVILDQDGNPIREAEVVLVNPSDPKGKAILDTAALGLGADGSFVTEVAAGSYAVSARGPGFSESDRAYIQVPPDADSSRVELRVSRKGSIAGQLHLPSDVAQLRPLEFDVVIETESGTRRNPLTRTDRRKLVPAADLSFKIEDVHAGRVRIRLELPVIGDHRVGPWASFTMTPGQQVTGVLVSLAEVGIAIAGSVRDDRGVVVPNATVSVGSRRVTTDLQGAFVIRGLDMGETGVEASLKGHANAYRAIDYQGSQLAVDLVLARLGEVAGQVRGQGVNGIPVLLIHNDDGAVQTFNAKTDAKGNYVFKDVPPGVYHLKAGKGADPFETSGAPTVSVQAGQRAQADPIAR